jgi:hypothetical protein
MKMAASNTQTRGMAASRKGRLEDIVMISTARLLKMDVLSLGGTLEHRAEKWIRFSARCSHPRRKHRIDPKIASPLPGPML